MDVKIKTHDIIRANPMISYDELIQELNRSLIDELQDGLNDLLKAGKIARKARWYYEVTE